MNVKPLFSSMSFQKTIEEIELIRESALLVSKTLGILAKEIKEGNNFAT